MKCRFFDKKRISVATEKDIVKWFFTDLPFSNDDLCNSSDIGSIFLDPETPSLWKDLTALSLLFSKDRSLDETKKLFSSFKPFSQGEKDFAELDKENLSLAFFPLNTGSSIAGSWSFLVLFEHSGTLFFDPKDCSWKKEWNDGNSWKLAFELAKKTLNEPDFKEKLAADWIITGDVDESGKVKRVELGNKLTLPTRRTWLVPLENEREVMKTLPEGKIANFADDLETGWNHITETGAKFSGVIDWPENTDELHILVGGNIKAQVASILLSNSKKIVLWHSDNKKLSVDPANYIKNIVIELKKRLFADLPEPILKQISFENLIDIENSLRKELKNCSNKKIIFNITSGNRIMGFGVQSIARQYPNAIDIIYRERDGVEHSFIILNYRSFPPYFGTVKGNCSLKLNYQFLYSAPKEQDYTNATDFLEKLII